MIAKYLPWPLSRRESPKHQSGHSSDSRRDRYWSIVHHHRTGMSRPQWDYPLLDRPLTHPIRDACRKKYSLPWALSAARPWWHRLVSTPPRAHAHTLTIHVLIGRIAVQLHEAVVRERELGTAHIAPHLFAVLCTLHAALVARGSGSPEVYSSWFPA